MVYPKNESVESNIITVLVGANADGSEKLPLLVIAWEKQEAKVLLKCWITASQL
jgi:hypothetical protein